MKKIKSVLLVLALALPLLLQPAMVYAACPTESEADTAEEQVLRGTAQTGNNCDDSQIMDTISAIIEVLSIVAGIAAVIVIILSGFKYITSAGDANKISSAKNTLIYAAVGLVIAALAQVIVHFVINTATDAPLKCPAGQHVSSKGDKCIPN